MTVGFLLMVCSALSLLILVSVLILAFLYYQHSFPAAQKRWGILALAVSVTFCHLPNLLIFGFEVGPTVLTKKPVYGETVHRVLGAITVGTHCSSLLHVLLLCLFGVHRLDDQFQTRDRSRIVPKILGVLLTWLLSASLGASAVISSCDYQYSVPDLTYKCRNGTTAPFICVFSVVSCSIPIWSVVLIAYGYRKVCWSGKVHETQAPDQTVATVPYEKPSQPIRLRKLWIWLLLGQIVISSIKSISLIAPSLDISPRSSWIGLSATISQMLCDLLSLLFYARFFVSFSNCTRQHTNTDTTIDGLDISANPENQAQKPEQHAMQNLSSMAAWTDKLMEHQVAKKRLNSVPIVRILSASPSDSPRSEIEDCSVKSQCDLLEIRPEYLLYVNTL